MPSGWAVTVHPSPYSGSDGGGILIHGVEPVQKGLSLGFLARGDQLGVPLVQLGDPPVLPVLALDIIEGVEIPRKGLIPVIADVPDIGVPVPAEQLGDPPVHVDGHLIHEINNGMLVLGDIVHHRLGLDHPLGHLCGGTDPLCAGMLDHLRCGADSG